ncbi:VWA domain-containing protein [Planctomycetota bacterium]|nr:VWA domain-containing protein [Planctomycetota bacterium]
MDHLRRWLAIGFRLLLLLLIVFMLAGLQTVRRNDVMTVIAVLDQSESVRKFAKPPQNLRDSTENNKNNGYSIEQWQEDLVRLVTRDRNSDDLVSVISYADRPIVRSLPSRDPDLQSAVRINSEGGTDTAAAIRTAIAQAKSDSSAKILLCSDMNDANSEDVLAAARDAAVAGIPISVAPVPYDVRDEVVVKAIHVPKDVREGQTVRLRVELEATDPTEGDLYILYDDQFVSVLDGKRSLFVAKEDWVYNSGQTETGRHFVAIKAINLPLKHSGINQFQAIFSSNEADHVDRIVANNVAESFTIVRGKGKLLFVDGIGGNSGLILPRSLMSHGMHMDIVPPDKFPDTLEKLQNYDAVIFQSVSAEYINYQQQENIVSYVHDLGGGFVMIGGPDSFGAGGWTNSKLDKTILPVTCQIPAKTILPSGALVLVIDHSGSMANSVIGSRFNQQVLANEAAVLALKTLYPQDLVGVVAFSGSAEMVWDIQVNAQPHELAARVRSIAPAGGTNIYAGLELAFEKLAPLRTQDAAIKHVILLTDGNSSSDNYVKLLGKMMKTNITLSTVGIGDAKKSQLLHQLARMGGGKYHPVHDPNNLPQIFVKEAKTIRKNLIKEVAFTPSARDVDSPLLTSISELPLLQGYVLTGEKHEANVFNALLGPEEEPLLAHMQVGLGRTVAFTSDAHNRWAVNWLGWDQYENFWARVVRYVARPTQSREYDVFARVEGDHIKVRLDAGHIEENASKYSNRMSFQNDLLVQGAAILPDGTVEKIELEQVGPGLYEAKMSAEQEGNYVLELQMVDEEGKVMRASTGVTRLPGEELRRFRTNLNLAGQVAEITGGHIILPTNYQPDSLFAGERPVTKTMRSIWRYLLVLLLIAFFVDVANRRISWDTNEVFAWYQKRKAERARRHQRASVQTISTLRQTRERTTVGMEGNEDALASAALTVDAMRQKRKANTLASIRRQAIDKRLATTKFEASENATTSENFLKEMGAAQDTDEKHKKVFPQNVPKHDAQEEMTSRLLDAKRKAKKRLDREQNK